MKVQTEYLEEDILEKKEVLLEDNNVNKFNIKSFILKKTKNLFLCFSTISFVSFFFLNNHISFAQQLSFVSTREFSVSLCMLFGLLSALYILNGIFTTAKKGEVLSKQFSSIWLPIQYAIISSFFIPYDGTTSLVSESIIEVITLLSKFF